MEHLISKTLLWNNNEKCHTIFNAIIYSNLT